MKNTGLLMLIGGILLGLFVLNMDTSVHVDYPMGNPFGMPDRVNNLGLMNDRQNYLIFAGFLSLIGSMMYFFSKLSSKRTEIENEDEYKKCPQCAEKVKTEAKICRYCNHIFAEQKPREEAKEETKSEVKEKTNQPIKNKGFVAWVHSNQLPIIILLIVISLLSNSKLPASLIFLVLNYKDMFGKRNEQTILADKAKIAERFPLLKNEFESPKGPSPLDEGNPITEFPKRKKKPSRLSIIIFSSLALIFLIYLGIALQLNDKETEAVQKDDTVASMIESQQATVTQETIHSATINTVAPSNNIANSRTKKLRYLFYANGGLRGYFDDGSITACPYCDLIKYNVQVLYSAELFGTYTVEEGVLLINGNEKEYPDTTQDWAMIDYKWIIEIPDSI